MTAYDDDYQRQLDYERELERQEYERQLRLEEDERQRQLEEYERRRRFEAAAPLGSQRKRSSQSDGARGWNWRWARRTREDDYRRAREADEKRWAEERRHRRHRSFLYPVFVGALLLLLSFFVVRLLGLYSTVSTSTAAMAQLAVLGSSLSGPFPAAIHFQRNGHRLAPTLTRYSE